MLSRLPPRTSRMRRARVLVEVAGALGQAGSAEAARDALAAARAAAESIPHAEPRAWRLTETRSPGWET
jgi:hypothetical protein